MMSGRRPAGKYRFECVVNVSRPVESRPADARRRSTRRTRPEQGSRRSQGLPSTQQRRNPLSGFKIPEQGECGCHQTQAPKSPFLRRALASYAADSVAVAGLVRPSRVLAARAELLEAMRLLRSLPGTREAQHSPRRSSTSSSRQKQSNTLCACRSPLTRRSVVTSRLRKSSVSAARSEWERPESC
jgi:hypothetical protein